MTGRSLAAACSVSLVIIFAPEWHYSAIDVYEHACDDVVLGHKTKVINVVELTELCQFFLVTASDLH